MAVSPTFTPTPPTPEPVPEHATLLAWYRVHREALSRAQKPSRGTPAYSRLVNRPVARRVAAAAHVVGLSPNAATVFGALLTGTALALLVVNEPSLELGLSVSALLALGYVMDSVDGQLARLRGGGSVSGEWLDHTLDCVKTCAFHLAVLVSLFRFPPVESEAALVLPMVFLVVDMTTYFGIILVPYLRRRAPLAAAAEPRREHPLRTWLVLPNDYGTFCWVFVLLAWPQVFLGGYAALLAANAAFLLLACAKWWRELRLLDVLGA
ncbi:CDP-alcohol phosphatidyltransferase family protein [Nocardioides sp. cx-173]|uniref:CDP-alcohol phosphatidyltransferase family protein n=1 Tax=Nocardioides sp. cx-173 TaxID=2898796 RepID=UPI001E60EA2C|nr:CDP-alcohol phosphatidyltransferase family protein [Nocardioides sp. cx-173]MCD4526670.1 CDP-alcohol phosphatidyltransferase family protein [Nocardioides sp. cx-173]UGB42587.1 CDP-alcohol phosphatidyltransferase family protein [Nocardioides sp. cx-173]